VLAVQQSARMAREPSARADTTSAQYRVPATTRASSPTARRITVALGWRPAMRREC